MDIMPLFPTPIGSFSNFITEEERVELFENIKKINHYKHGSFEGKSGSSHSESDRGGLTKSNILNNSIRKRLQNSVDQYTKESCNLPCKITNIWSNIQHSGSILKEHCHPNSVISGALYINANDLIWFHNPNPYVFYTASSSHNYYNCEWYNIPVQSCQLVLFPSWLKHGKNDAPCKMDDRMVISFNTNYMINYTSRCVTL